jgi:hypothetical protein
MVTLLTLVAVSCLVSLIHSLSSQHGKVTTQFVRRFPELQRILHANNRDNAEYEKFIANTSDLKVVLDQLMERIGKNVSMSQPSSKTSGGAEEIAEAKLIIQGQFATLLADLRASSLSSSEKKVVFASLLVRDLLYTIETSEVAGAKDLPSMPTNVVKSSILNPAIGSIVFVHGTGLVSQKCLEMIDILGKTASIKKIPVDSVSVMSDKEFEYALRGARSIIIAADAPPLATLEGGGMRWFGGTDDVPKLTLDGTRLKRLLNAAMKEKSIHGDQSIKVVFMDYAAKEVKGLASFLTGDTTELSSELILQCNQRGLGYGVVKFGKIVNDGADGVGRDGYVTDSSSFGQPQSAGPDPRYSAPLVFTSSKHIEAMEVTRVSVAAEALFRSASHPQMNSTVTVLSTKDMRKPTNSDWEDEFLRIVGPELVRIPLCFTSERQAALRVRRIAQELKRKVVTPVEIEPFSNGVRILFRPTVDTGYKSSKDERKEAQATEEGPVGPTKGKRQGVYQSPEEEKQEEGKASQRGTPKNVQTKKAQKPEGGLEVFVDSVPYKRIRIKRCNMGSGTIVKVESEAMILREITDGIRVLENDYRLLLQEKA